MPWINARYSSKCAECEDRVVEGERVFYDPESQKVYCEANGCGSEFVASNSLGQGRKKISLTEAARLANPNNLEPPKHPIKFSK